MARQRRKPDKHLRTRGPSLSLSETERAAIKAVYREARRARLTTAETEAQFAQRVMLAAVLTYLHRAVAFEALQAAEAREDSTEDDLAIWAYCVVENVRGMRRIENSDAIPHANAIAAEADGAALATGNEPSSGSGVGLVVPTLKYVVKGELPKPKPPKVKDKA